MLFLVLALILSYNVKNCENINHIPRIWGVFIGNLKKNFNSYNKKSLYILLLIEGLLYYSYVPNLGEDMKSK